MLWGAGGNRAWSTARRRPGLDLRHLRSLGELSRRGEGLLQERAAETQALRVDAVADAFRHVPLDGEARLAASCSRAMYMASTGMTSSMSPCTSKIAGAVPGSLRQRLDRGESA